MFDYKRKSIGTDVCLSELSHYRNSKKKKKQELTHRKQLKPRTDEAQKKKTRKNQRKASLRAR